MLCYLANWTAGSSANEARSQWTINYDVNPTMGNMGSRKWQGVNESEAWIMETRWGRGGRWCRAPSLIWAEYCVVKAANCLLIMTQMGGMSHPRGFWALWMKFRALWMRHSVSLWGFWRAQGWVSLVQSHELVRVEVSIWGVWLPFWWIPTQWTGEPVTWVLSLPGKIYPLTEHTFELI